MAQECYQAMELYVFLSVTQADMVHGFSVPYIGTNAEKKNMLFLFTSHRLAKQFIAKGGYEVLDNILPLGKVENHHDGALGDICLGALNAGATHIAFDYLSRDSYEFPLASFLEANDLSAKPGLVPMKRIHILDFHDDYVISDKRAEQLLEHVFRVNSIQEAKLTFLTMESLHESCFVSDHLNKRMIPMAERRNKEQDIRYLNFVDSILSNSIWRKLEWEPNLYLLINENRQPYIRDGSIFVTYTDRYKYMGEYSYRKLSGQEEIADLVRSDSIQYVTISDGVHYVAKIPRRSVMLP